MRRRRNWLRSSLIEFESATSRARASSEWQVRSQSAVRDGADRGRCALRRGDSMPPLCSSLLVLLARPLLLRRCQHHCYSASGELTTGGGGTQQAAGCVGELNAPQHRSLLSFFKSKRPDRSCVETTDCQLTKGLNHSSSISAHSVCAKSSETAKRWSSFFSLLRVCASSVRVVSCRNRCSLPWRLRPRRRFTDSAALCSLLDHCA